MRNDEREGAACLAEDRASRRSGVWRKGASLQPLLRGTYWAVEVQIGRGETISMDKYSNLRIRRRG